MKDISITRDEAELLVELIDQQDRNAVDSRLVSLADEIREKFGMVTREQEQQS